MSNCTSMRTSIGHIFLLSLLLVAPAWACDMGGLFLVIVFAMATGAALGSIVSALLAWVIRPTPIAAPFGTLCFSILAGTAGGTGVGIAVGAAMPNGFQFLWAAILVSIAVSSAIVSLAPGLAGNCPSKGDQPVPGLPDAPASFHEQASEWKTLS